MADPSLGHAAAQEAAPPERDVGWRWRTGGLAGLGPGQRRDAEAAFDAWLRRHGRYELNGVRVDGLADFVDAIQGASARACGLEAFRPAVEDDPGRAARPGARPEAEAAAGSLREALAAFLAAYRAYDAEFERSKRDGSPHDVLERSPQAHDLDRAAWRLSEASMDAAAAAGRAGCRLVGSPLRHPFLAARTRRRLAAVLLPLGPGAGAADGEAGDAVPGTDGRAAMLRWLEGVGRLEAFARAAEARGFLLSATGQGLTRTQRADLRGLRAEMAGLLSLKLDVAAQAEAVRAAEGDAEPGRPEGERKILARLEEMLGHHRARATFFWVRSFHFSAAAQAEALAPRLVGAVREEIEPGVAGQSGQIERFVDGQPPDLRRALGGVAEAAAAALAGQGSEPRGEGLAGAAARLADGAAAAAKAVLMRATGKVRAALPALARHALALLSAAERTPLERLAAKVGDWRLDGLAAADRRMRRMPDAAARASAGHTLVGYARAVAGDAGLLLRVRAADPSIAVRIERLARAGGGGTSEARTAAAPTVDAGYGAPEGPPGEIAAPRPA